MSKTNKCDKVGFFEFVYVWFRLQGLKLPRHQKIMTRWLSDVYTGSRKRRALLMAFRNSGKSTIVGLYCGWLLYCSRSLRILVLAADYALAKKMVRNVKRIIEQHPLTKGLKPARLDQWASDQFTVNRELELRDPSVLAKGIGANITGLRADVIICDDVEIPKNCDTSLKRQDLREKLSELDYILTPDGLQLYIGTPHSFYTIYQTEPDDKKTEIQPFLLGFDKLELPILLPSGKSAWPERFSEEKIASIRSRSGENKFLSQMMLQPVNIATGLLDASRLVPYDDELRLVSSNRRDYLYLGKRKMLSASCWWDPSFAAEKGDNSVIACVFSDEEGHYWLHDLEYIRVSASPSDNVASLQIAKVTDFLERNFLPSVHVEANGIGKFLPGMLRQALAERRLRIAVLENYSSEAKTERILKAFEVLLAARALHVRQTIWQTPFIEEMREFSLSSKGHDDALDAVSGCLLSEPVRLGSLPLSGAFRRVVWQGKSSQYAAKTGFEIYEEQ